MLVLSVAKPVLSSWYNYSLRTSLCFSKLKTADAGWWRRLKLPLLLPQLCDDEAVVVHSSARTFFQVFGARLRRYQKPKPGNPNATGRRMDAARQKFTPRQIQSTCNRTIHTQTPERQHGSKQYYILNIYLFSYYKVRIFKNFIISDTTIFC